jgi:hypothetical protein
MGEIITLALFSIFMTGWFTPFNKPREWITDKWIRMCIKLNLYFLMDVIVVFSCSKCFGFWFTLIYTQSFILALNVGFLSFIITFIINEINKRNEQ